MIPPLHVLVGDREIGDPEAEQIVARLLERLGADVAVHLRARRPARELYERAAGWARVADGAGGWCVVNGRVDVALAAGARAVQLGRGSIGVRAARRCVERSAPAGWSRRPPLRVGASVHGVEEARRTVAEGADYLVLGTIFETPSHPGRPGAGVDRIAAVRSASGTEGAAGPPVLAIGGIDRARVADVLRAGADGIVVYRAVWGAPDPIAAARELRERLAGSTAGREARDPATASHEERGANGRCPEEST